MSDEEFEQAKRVVERHGYTVLPAEIKGPDFLPTLVTLRIFLRSCSTSIVGLLNHETRLELDARNEKIRDEWTLDASDETIETVFNGQKGSTEWYLAQRERHVREIMKDKV